MIAYLPENFPMRGSALRGENVTGSLGSGKILLRLSRVILTGYVKQVLVVGSQYMQYYL